MTNLTQLQTFVEVARLNSFAATAEHLQIPRSTVTARVQALEERLGVQLLHRTTRRVSLTQEGERFLQQCEPALQALQQAESDLLEKDEISGNIRLSVPIDYPVQTLHALLGSFADKHPKVSFYVDMSDSTVDLVAEHFDLAIRARKPGEDNLIAQRYAYDLVGLFSRKPQKLITEENISSFPLMDPGHFLAEFSANSPRASFIETTNLRLVKQLALSKDCIAVLPLTLCQQEVEQGQLIQLKTTLELPRVPLYIVTPARKHRPKRIRAFIQHIVESRKHSVTTK
ncbi:LysR family transcriptional regulator [Pseudovibrio japonicus]|uniref:LysR family transcriptional regulator n=1 Tax=Pseudovibrio japonicus TaxID=366534 RepID=A0ABQ3ELH2_9HYPH|nr:LysR family transcriptional regulator [Pseudovibrio japonicus]GHB40490.1 LysR family transcriptional regulator [Pseudovibrio japonicus]